jgi:hypothetical protein
MKIMIINLIKSPNIKTIADIQTIGPMIKPIKVFISVSFADTSNFSYVLNFLCIS